VKNLLVQSSPIYGPLDAMRREVTTHHDQCFDAQKKFVYLDKSLFKVLSYTWSVSALTSAIPSGKIEVDGTPLPIRANLVAAKRMLEKGKDPLAI
jgi:hypothetical protein